ncbi:MAG TPA: MFS transporter [Egibacteraceae bacterium]|nr:MFS transporter [Actinomycetota bacterium]HWB70846.1 MFS transporter [Egibacteraceae bacterium]
MDTTRGDAAGETMVWGSPGARWVLGATVGASALALLDATTVNVALPAIGADLDATFGGLQWTVNAYTLVLAALILLSGSLADRFGRRRVFVVGIAWFTLASLLCAAAPTIGLLVAGRALQGAGGALLTPGSLAILQASFAPGDRARAIGAWAGLGGIAAAVGPLLGGVLIGTLGWRAIFWINVPVTAAVLWATLRHVPGSRPTNVARRFDVAGSLLATVGLGVLTWALITGGERGADPLLVTVGAVGVLALALFVVVERRAAEPMMPLELFTSRQFSGTNLVTFVVYGGMAGLFFLLVVHLQVVLGYPPLLAGSALLPVTLLMLVLSPRAGALAERLGPRRPMTAGPLVMATGLVLIARLDAGSSYLVDLLPAIVVFGLGLSALVTPLTATALAAAPDHRSGVASGINNAISRTGGLLAVAALPPLAGITGDAFNDPARFAAGFATAMHASAGLIALGGVLALFTIRDQLPDGRTACPHSRTLGPRRCPVDGSPLQPDNGLVAAGSPSG